MTPPKPASMLPSCLACRRSISSHAAVIVPADVPFATAADVRAVIGELGHFPIVLAPASSTEGPMRWRCAGPT